MTGLVAGIGRNRAYVSWKQISQWAHGQVLLSQNKVNLSAFERRPGEVLLRADLFDHRLIDVLAAEWVRAYDVELEDTGTDWVLARLDTRGPARLFGLVKPGGGHASRDWKSFEPLIGHQPSSLERRARWRFGKLKPAQIANFSKTPTSGRAARFSSAFMVIPSWKPMSSKNSTLIRPTSCWTT